MVAPDLLPRLKEEQYFFIGWGPEQATVMVTDIRGYTTLSEQRSPVEVLKLLTATTSSRRTVTNSSAVTC